MLVTPAKKKVFDDETPNALTRSGLVLQKKETISVTYYKYDTREASSAVPSEHKQEHRGLTYIGMMNIGGVDKGEEYLSG